jgi:hypothetical protein
MKVPLHLHQDHLSPPHHHLPRSLPTLHLLAAPVIRHVGPHSKAHGSLQVSTCLQSCSYTQRGTLLVLALCMLLRTLHSSWPQPACADHLCIVSGAVV